MKSADLMIVLAILIFFFFPTSALIEQPIDPFEIYSNEGLVAMDIATNQGDNSPDPEPKPDNSECTCNGTGREKSGDGIIDVPCRCGDKCTCNGNQPEPDPDPSPNPPEPPSPDVCNCGCRKQGCQCRNRGYIGGCQNPSVKYQNIEQPSSAKPEPKTSTKKAEPKAKYDIAGIHIMDIQIIYLYTDYCTYCDVFDKNDIPKLVELGWGCGIKKEDYIKKINADKYPEIYNKYGGGRGFPLFILLKDGKEVDSLMGYHTAGQVTDMFNKHYGK